MDAIRKKLHQVPLPRRPRLHLPDLALSATISRGLRRRHDAGRAVQTWWASHTLEAVLWALGMALAVVAGLLVARL
jgi:hypothetical protein